jgi:hypothetical protein
MRFRFEDEELEVEARRGPDRSIWALLSIARSLHNIDQTLALFVATLRPRLSATLHVQGENNMATLLVGKTGQANWQEFSGPNGTGDKLPPAGAVSYTSSNPAVATVDPSSGLVTAVAVGTATITGVDAANSLTASDSVTDTEVAASATLTVVPN